MAAMKKPKCYVVWVGLVPGVYTSWEKAKAQIHQFPGAKYKSYESPREAEAAFAQGYPVISSSRNPVISASRNPIISSSRNPIISSSRNPVIPSSRNLVISSSRNPVISSSRNPVIPSFAVDAACDMTTGVMEYRGVDVETGAEIFRMGPYQGSSNNHGEFLAIVHCLAFCKQRGLTEPIYTDSRTALSWVRHQHAKTTVAKTSQNTEVFALITRAENWLKANTYPNRLLKWETKKWGENPADFGRK